MLSFDNFITWANGSPAELNRPKAYLKTHSIRFYDTYKICRKVLPTSGSLLSIGSGRAFVEYVVAKEIGAKVTVFDFQEAIERNHDQYEAFDFVTIPGNFLCDGEKISEKYDAIIFGEILEHIPLAPEEQIKALITHLKPGGHLIISTPNVASLNNIIDLWREKNIIANANDLFSPVGAKNERVHRRVYTMKEITEAMTKSGLSVVSADFTYLRGHTRSLWSMGFYYFLKLFKRKRPVLLVTGRL